MFRRKLPRRPKPETLTICIEIPPFSLIPTANAFVAIREFLTDIYGSPHCPSSINWNSITIIDNITYQLTSTIDQGIGSGD